MKKVFLSIFLISAIFLLNGCSKSKEEGIVEMDEEWYENTSKAVQEINQNSNMGYDLFLQGPQNFAEAVYDLYDEDIQYELSEPDCRYIYNEEGTKRIVECYHSIYPYLGLNKHTWGERKLTHMYIYSSDFNVFGISIGQNTDNVEIIMDEHGYALRDTENITHDEMIRIVYHHTHFIYDVVTDEIIEKFLEENEILLYEKYDVDITIIKGKETELITGLDVRVYNFEKMFYVYY